MQYTPAAVGARMSRLQCFRAGRRRATFMGALFVMNILKSKLKKVKLGPKTLPQ